MSTPGLFVVGVLVTLILAAALTLLVYAAVLDGRDAAARELADQQQQAQSAADGGAILA